MSNATREPIGWTRILLNKVPEVTLAFWVIKVMSARLGRTTLPFMSASAPA